MLHFVDFQHHVALLHGFVQFGGAPGARQRPLLVGVRTLPGLIVQGSVELVFDAGPTQWKGQSLPCAIGQDGMVQAWGRQHGTFGHTKVRVEVHGVGGVDELRVPHGGSGRSCSSKGRDWRNRSNGSLPLGRRCDAIAPHWCVRQRTPREAAEGVGGAGTPRSRPPRAGPGVAGASRIPTSPPPCTRGLSETGLWPG